MFGSRLISGIILVVLALFTMGLGGGWLLIVSLLISLIAFKELTRALLCSTDDKKLNVLEILGMLGIIAYYAAIYFSEEEVLLLMCIVGVFMALMFAYVMTFPKFTANQVMGGFFSFMYAPVMLSFVYLTRECVQGSYMVWMILISAWGCDTSAYVVGKLIGKKKIFPILSPHKSLEGCIGGVCGAVLLGGLYGYFFVEKMFPEQRVAWLVAFICGAGAVMSMVGDLAASAIKRNNNIKDYGHIIPGHGGIMDRFDSMIVTAPMIYFLSVWLFQL